MGQRTQVLIIKHSRDGQKQTEFYHNQWGYGRCMYLAVMYLYIRYYNTSVTDFEDRNASWEENKKHRETRFIFRHGTLEGMNNFQNELSYLNADAYPAQREFYNTADIDDFDSVWNVCGTGDNNNGWCVIDVTPGKDEYSAPHFKVGWIAGSEDYSEYDKQTDTWHNNGYYRRWLTAEEYARINGGSNYTDKKFIQMYRAFCDYFGIEDIVTAQKEKKATVSA